MLLIFIGIVLVVLSHTKADIVTLVETTWKENAVAFSLNNVVVIRELPRA